MGDADLVASVDPFATDASPGGLRAAVAATASLRGVVAPFHSPDDADVVDPYRRSSAVYEQSAAEIGPAVDVVAALLARAAERG